MFWSKTVVRRPVLAIAGAAVLAAGALTAVTVTASADTTAAPAETAQLQSALRAASGKAKPTIAFVHGSWADGNGFDAELQFFGDLGYPVTAIPNPLRGLTSDAANVRAQLQAIKGPIVLVAHSYGGAVITEASSGLPNVQALVYLAGWGLDDGESTTSLSMRFPGSHIDGNPASPGYSFRTVAVANPFAPTGQSLDQFIKYSDFADIFAGDVSKQRAALEAETQRPQTDFAGTSELTGVPAWKQIPSWYLMTLDDHAIPPTAQKFMATRMKAQLSRVHSAHDVMISHPVDVEITILRALAGR